MRRQFLFSGGMMLCFACVCFISAKAMMQGGVSKSTFDRIQDGMTEQEVAQIIGKPPSDTVRGFCDPGNTLHGRIWNGDDGASIRVEFYNNIATEKTWCDPDDTFLWKALRWGRLAPPRPVPMQIWIADPIEER